ncbi:(4Fe-4S)-binding protein [Deinococcus alpinitundrae]|uniref:(4Fe-4S)-binding protein n=1 Tax=Deinococcus alpinitundrae TaxID=468913 RepID=UPI00137AD96C|nr:(4Fe-4S)-binding protein [Deinococcus alpinitundrae]
MSQPAVPPPPAPDWGRAYSAPDLTVYYAKARCIHFAACIRGLPQVFNTAARPWIQADAAPAEQVAEVVRRCPTGALHYTLNSGPTESAGPTRIEVRANGPLFVRGELLIAAPQGSVHETRAALCRCGASQNKPYCDGSHRQSGFEAAGGEGMEP